MKSRTSRAPLKAAGRWTALGFCALMLTVVTTAAAAGRDFGHRAPRSEVPAPKSLSFEVLKASTTDLENDTIGGDGPVDIMGFSADAIGGNLVISVTFFGNIDPPASGGPNAIDGFIDIDVDQNGATGMEPFVDTVGTPASGLGNEYYVELFNYDAIEGTVELIDEALAEVAGEVPISFTSSSFTVSIPLSLLGNDDGAVNTAALMFQDVVEGPADKVPNTGSLSSGAGTGSPNTVFLQGNRFTVDVEWTDFDNVSGPGKLITQSDDSAVLYFFSDDNWEMLIKVLDGCAINDRYWVFFAATTDVEFTMTVTDTQSNETRVFDNPLGQAADAVTDTDAFATCP